MLEQIISIDCKDGIKEMWWFMVLVFNATIDNISVISWRSVLSVVETGENQQPAASH